MMRRNDLLLDPRFITPEFRRANWAELHAEIRDWVLTFRTIEELEAQVSEAGLAVGTIRTVRQIAESEWAKERGAIREVDDRSGEPLEYRHRLGSSARRSCRMPVWHRFRVSTTTMYSPSLG